MTTGWRAGLRWATVLPAAALGAWLVWIVSHLGNAFAGFAPDDWRVQLLEDTAFPAVLGASFVYIGARVAPHHKKITAFCLGGLAILAAGALLFAATLASNWWGVAGAIFLALGSGAALFSIHTGELRVGE